MKQQIDTHANPVVKFMRILGKSVRRLQSWIKESMIAHNNRAVVLSVYQKKRSDGA